MFTRDDLTFHGAYAEYNAVYAEPAFESWNRQVLAQALHRELATWSVKVDDITFNQPSVRAADQHVSAALFAGNVIVEVGIAKARLMINSPGWQHRDLFREVGEKMLEAVVGALNAGLHRQFATIGFHFSVKGKTVSELTAIFLDPKSPLREEPGVNSFGVSAYRDDGDIVIDTSAIHDGALFMKIGRWFDSEATLQEIAETIRTEETRYLRLLGMSGD